MADTTNGNRANGRLRFDWTLTLGGAATLASVIGGGIFFLMQVTAQFTEVKSSINAMSMKLDLTVQRLEQRDGEHDRRLRDLERLRWRDPS